MEDKSLKAQSIEDVKLPLTTAEKILVAAAERQTLLLTLSSTYRAASDLTQIKCHITTLSNRIYDASQLASELRAKAAKELAEKQSLEGSRRKKFAYAIRG
jgi:hypothetical protein